MAIKIGDLLHKSVNQAGIGEQVDAAQVCTAFDRLIADQYPRIKDKVQAKFIKHGTLAVAVLSPAVAQEIKLHELKIMEIMQKKFGKNRIQRLRILTL